MVDGPRWSAASQVVKIKTDDMAETSLDPGFVEVCSKLNMTIQEAGPCGEVTVDLPDVHLSAVQQAVKYWDESRAASFDSAAYLRSVKQEAAWMLGYEHLLDECAKEFARMLCYPMPTWEEWEKTVIPDSWVQAAKEHSRW